MVTLRVGEAVAALACTTAPKSYTALGVGGCGVLQAASKAQNAVHSPSDLFLKKKWPVAGIEPARSAINFIVFMMLRLTSPVA